MVLDFKIVFCIHVFGSFKIPYMSHRPNILLGYQLLVASYDLQNTTKLCSWKPLAARIKVYPQLSIGWFGELNLPKSVWYCETMLYSQWVVELIHLKLLAIMMLRALSTMSSPNFHRNLPEFAQEPPKWKSPQSAFGTNNRTNHPKLATQGLTRGLPFSALNLLSPRVRSQPPCPPWWSISCREKVGSSLGFAEISDLRPTKTQTQRPTRIHVLDQKDKQTSAVRLTWKVWHIYPTIYCPLKAIHDPISYLCRSCRMLHVDFFRHR